MSKPTSIYYTRCPVPTASGIAFQGRMFENTFEGSNYEVRNIVELGPDNQNVHYTHTIDAFFREGGAAPPIWARANGIDSVVLGMTFIDELLGIYVRIDDDADTIAGLAGRRIALPVWPKLVFNFWKVVSLYAWHCALDGYGLSDRDVHYVDVVEDWDPSERRNVALDAPQRAARCEYRNQLKALEAGEVDAVFAKGPEAALLERESQGRVRLLADLRDCASSINYPRASIPRLLTTSRQFLQDHGDAVVDYIGTLIRAGHWADAHWGQAVGMIERECGLEAGQMDGYVGPQFTGKFQPRFEDGMLETLQYYVSFIRARGFSNADFDVEAWTSTAPLKTALERQAIPPR